MKEHPSSERSTPFPASTGFFWRLRKFLAGLFIAIALSTLILLYVHLPDHALGIIGLMLLLSIAIASILIILLVRSYRIRLREVERLGRKLALRTAQAQAMSNDLNAAQAITHIGSWVYDFARDIVTMSDETCRIFGLPEGSQGTRDGYFRFVHPDDLPALNQAIEEALKGKAVFSEHRIRINDTERWICQRARVEFEPNGKPLRGVGTTQDITTRRRAEDEIRHLAFYDPLTQLPNRRLLLDRLQQAMASSARTGRQGALMFLDLDNFKALNDSRGHDMGDLLLQHVAQRLSTCIREGDTVSRFGGDEFVIMLVDLSAAVEETAAQAEAIALKILDVLSQPYDLGGHPYLGTASIGISPFFNHQFTSFELLKQADLAMYVAKANGHNTLRFHVPAAPIEHGQCNEKT